MLDVVTIGDIKLDTFIALPHASVHCSLRPDDCQLCFTYGRKIPTASFTAQVAGTAANVARGAARLGLAASVISTVGGREHGMRVKHALREDGVATRHLHYEPEAAPAQAVVLMHRGESTQLVSQAPLVLRLPSPLPRTRALHVSELGPEYHSLFSALLGWKKDVPSLFLSLNPGAVQIAERKPVFLRLLERTDLLFVNTQEARQLLQVTTGTPARLCRSLQEITGGRVVVTDGAHGAYAHDGQQGWYAPLFPGPRVEATGAGDAFSTGVLSAILHQLPFATALAWGSCLATSVVGAIGPTEGLLRKASLQRQLREHARYRVQPL
jgi:sugar/nucleoside kinase (ribokinase family)